MTQQRRPQWWFALLITGLLIVPGIFTIQNVHATYKSQGFSTIQNVHATYAFQ